VIRTARAMRLVSDDRLGNIGVENDEKTNEIVLTYIERYGRIGEHDGSCRNIGYQIGDVTYAATFKAIVVVFVIAGVVLVVIVIQRGGISSTTCVFGMMFVSI
jgi:hypothetical protein